MKMLIQVFFVLILFVGMCYSQLSDDSLMAHYSFEGNAYDMTENGNDGIVNGAILTTDREGKENGAYYFDGIDDFIQVPDNNMLTPPSNKLTVAIWAKIYYPTNRFFLYKGDTRWNREYAMGLRLDSLASFGIYNYGLGSGVSGVPSRTVLEEDEWYHIVGTWDGTNQKIYINSMLANQLTAQVDIENYESDLYLGSYGGDIPGYAINAVIDDIKIYGRALSDEDVLKLYCPYMSPDFTADITTGAVPLTVKFSDQSTTTDPLYKIHSWEWDFDGDGMKDSDEQNPEWIYSKSGSYTVRLTISDSLYRPSISKENYIKVYSEKPAILTVNDIPDDQGGWVRVEFIRSIYDTDSLQGDIASAELYTIEINDGSAGWMATTSLTAYGKDQYAALVPTTKDFTIYGNSGLIDFRVIAAMQEGNFASDVFAGYSIDNLDPSIPWGLIAVLGESNSVELYWDPSIDNDVQHFNIYRNIENYFDHNSEPIAETSDTHFTDDQAENENRYYYTLKAIDHSGNESGYSDVVSIQITSVSDKKDGIPSTYFISQNYPNPFNPVTIISYGLPKSSNVKIRIFDVSGREVRTLVDEKQHAGTYNVNWNAMDNSGKNVSSGLYFYKIESAGFQKINKMMLIK